MLQVVQAMNRFGSPAEDVADGLLMASDDEDQGAQNGSQS